MQFGVHIVVAMPLPSVMAKGALQDAPELGAVNSTRTPGARRPAPSRTVAMIFVPAVVAVIDPFCGASTAP